MSWVLKWIWRLLAVLALVVFLLGPVDILEIYGVADDTSPLFCIPMPLPDSVVSVYIHSVQKTPVEDVYYMRGGCLWQWEERFISHNAGLPVESPPNACFLKTAEWMIIRGGRLALENLVYRVGSESLGRNLLIFPNNEECALYTMYPGERLDFRTRQVPLLISLIGIRYR